MSAGQFTLFDSALVHISGTINLASDTFKYAFINSTLAPTASTANPCWGAGGSTNFSTYEATPTGGSYAAGGIALTGVTYTQTSGTATFDSDDLLVTQNAGNPTDARYVIVYSSTAANKNALGFIDLDGVTDLSVGGFSYTVPSGGYFSIGRA